MWQGPAQPAWGPPLGQWFSGLIAVRKCPRHPKTPLRHPVHEPSCSRSISRSLRVCAPWQPGHCSAVCQYAPKHAAAADLLAVAGCTAATVLLADRSAQARQAGARRAAAPPRRAATLAASCGASPSLPPSPPRAPLPSPFPAESTLPGLCARATPPARARACRRAPPEPSHKRHNFLSAPSTPSVPSQRIARSSASSTTGSSSTRRRAQAVAGIHLALLGSTGSIRCQK